MTEIQARKFEFISTYNSLQVECIHDEAFLRLLGNQLHTAFSSEP